MRNYYRLWLEGTVWRLVAVRGVLTAARTLVRSGASMAQRRMLVTLEIPSKDRSYPWFLEWIDTLWSAPPLA
jgi:hypothetical protein